MYSKFSIGLTASGRIGRLDLYRVNGDHGDDELNNFSLSIQVSPPIPSKVISFHVTIVTMVI
jgi:hypothetical protein